MQSVACTAHLEFFFHFFFGLGILVLEDIVSGVQVHQYLTTWTLRTVLTIKCVLVERCKHHVNKSIELGREGKGEK